MTNIAFSSQFIEIFDHLCQKFGIVVDWSAKNVVPYVQELCGRAIKYIAFKNVFFVFVFAGIFYLLWRFTKPFCSKENKWDDSFQYVKSMNVSYVFSWITRALCSIITVIGIVNSILTIIRCFWIPEIIILNILNSCV